jgi:hypothetical protein
MGEGTLYVMMTLERLLRSAQADGLVQPARRFVSGGILTRLSSRIARYKRVRPWRQDSKIPDAFAINSAARATELMRTRAGHPARQIWRMELPSPGCQGNELKRVIKQRGQQRGRLWCGEQHEGP